MPSRFFRTSEGVRPAARIVPAYGTVMLPLESTIWSGSVTKSPGPAPPPLGRKTPPASASKIVTLTTSPMPRVILLGGRRENTFDAFAPHRILAFAFAGVWYLPLHSFIERASGTGVRNPRATAAAKTIVVFLISIGRSPNLQGEFYVKECFLSLGCFSRSSISSGSDRVCSLRRDQTSTCRNNPTVTPQNNRIDCSKSRNGVASGNLPDAIRSLQHSSSISNLPYYPSINCSRLCFRKRCRPWFRFVTDGR